MQSKETVIFLDVDGVVNYLGRLKHPYGYPINDHVARGFLLQVPSFMPELIQNLHERHEIHWLTTWRHEANTHVAPILGIPELPVITDGGDTRWVDWKEAEARPLAEMLVNDGKRVIWIEDFYGHIPNISNIEYIDTGNELMLCPWDVNFLLPKELHVPEPGYFANPLRRFQRI